MTNFSAKILNNAVTALAAQQARIAVSGNNIANLNTEGYSRRTVQLETRISQGRGGTVDVGSGVEVGSINRVVDEFLERELREAKSVNGNKELQQSFLSRIESLFNLTGESPTVGSTLNAFFSAAQDLTTDPANIQLRQNFLERQTDLINSLKDTYGSLADMQVEADQRLGGEISTVNTMTAQIASLNGVISSREGAGQVAADERDQREQLIQRLAEKLSFSSVEQADGSVSIFLANGFPLVGGTGARALEVTSSPSFSTGTLPPGLGGSTMSYIVFDYDSSGGQSHLDLSATIQGGEGSLSGLLAIRGVNDPANTSAFQGNGILVEAASRIEAITRSLLINVNTTYLGPDRDSATANHQPSSGDLNGATPGVFGLFSVTFSGVLDDGDGLPELTDLTAATGYDNFTSVLRSAVTTPRGIAAARDSSSGPPAAAVFAPGDSRNIAAIAALRDTAYAFSAAPGSYSFSGTFEGAYQELVGHVGTVSSTARIEAQVALSSLTAAEARRDEVSAPSLDEEFANLIRDQKAYEANARMLSIGQRLLDTLFNSL